MYSPSIGSFIMVYQCLYWTICLLKRILETCCRSPVPSENMIQSEVLLELMGDPRADTQASALLRKGIPEVQNTKGRASEDDNFEIPEPMQRI